MLAGVDEAEHETRAIASEGFNNYLVTQGFPWSTYNHDKQLVIEKL
jgi:hypothetical protein